MMNESEVKYLISLVLSNANDALIEYRANKDNEFIQGKRLAYYEILDSLKNELIAQDVDLSEFGLDVDLDKLYA